MPSNFDHICAQLRRSSVKVRLMALGENAGEQEGLVIRLDPQTKILPVLIHETLHLIYPDWTEKRVLREEARIASRLSNRQYRKLFFLLNEKLRER